MKTLSTIILIAGIVITATSNDIIPSIVGVALVALSIRSLHLNNGDSDK